MSETRKIALTTGGSRGLGQSTALHLAKKGVDVLITYQLKKSEAEATVNEVQRAGVKGMALKLDTSDFGSFSDFARSLREQLEKHWNQSSFNFLVNNAGISTHANIGEVSLQDIDKVFKVNVLGTFLLTQTVLPMIADGGHIINLSSGLARFTNPGFSAYAMTKGALEVFTRYLAKELGPRRITANTVAPGAIATDFAGGMVRDNPQANKAVADATALGRAGEAEDIGPMIASLLSEDNQWVNGQRIEVSGGAYL